MHVQAAHRLIKLITLASWLFVGACDSGDEPRDVEVAVWSERTTGPASDGDAEGENTIVVRASRFVRQRRSTESPGLMHLEGTWGPLPGKLLLPQTPGEVTLSLFLEAVGLGEVTIQAPDGCSERPTLAARAEPSTLKDAHIQDDDPPLEEHLFEHLLTAGGAPPCPGRASSSSGTIDWTHVSLRLLRTPANGLQGMAVLYHRDLLTGRDVKLVLEFENSPAL